MGRSIIFNPLTTSRPLDVRATPQASSSKLSKADLESRLRQKRSANYIRTMTQLDAGCHCQDPRAVEALIAAIQQELPEVTIDKLPIGIVSRCFLGEDYEVHTLDRTGGIIQHYRRQPVASAVAGTSPQFGSAFGIPVCGSLCGFLGGRPFKWRYIIY